MGQSPGWSAEMCGSSIKRLGMGTGLNAGSSALEQEMSPWRALWVKIIKQNDHQEKSFSLTVFLFEY